VKTIGRQDIKIINPELAGSLIQAEDQFSWNSSLKS